MLQDDRNADYVHLTDLSPSDVGFDSHKFVSEEVSRLYALDTDDGFTGFVVGNKFIMFDDYAHKINGCGRWLKYLETSDGLKLVDARFCKVPNCPMCQWRRSLKWRAKFLELLPSIQENFSSHKWLFLTLTIRNCNLDNLKVTIKYLNESFNRLSKNVRFPIIGLVKSVEITRIWDCYDNFTDEYLGRHGAKWIYSYEIKNNTSIRVDSTNEVHPHLHIVGLVKSSYFKTPNYIKQSEWTEMWKKALRVNYKPILNIKVVKSKKGNSILPSPIEFDNDNSIDNGMISGLCETLKYTVKEQDLIGKYCDDDQANSIWLKKITQQLYKSRRVEYRGVLKEIGKQLQIAYEDDDLIKINDEKEDISQIDLEFTFTWKKVLARYILSK